MHNTHYTTLSTSHTHTIKIRTKQTIWQCYSQLHPTTLLKLVYAIERSDHSYNLIDVYWIQWWAGLAAKTTLVIVLFLGADVGVCLLTTALIQHWLDVFHCLITTCLHTREVIVRTVHLHTHVIRTE